jgi:hypothetical protein
MGNFKQRNDSVLQALGYGMDDGGGGGSCSPGRGWEFFSSTPGLNRLRGPPSLLSNGYQGLFPWRYIGRVVN